LQTTDQFEDALRHLVEKAYEDLFDAGGATMTSEDLQNYFRVTSSPSQAKNATRFFLEVSKLAAIPIAAAMPAAARGEAPDFSGTRAEWKSPSAHDTRTEDVLLTAKAKLLEKLPPPRPDWTAAEYQAICDRFLEMLRILDGGVSSGTSPG
jgi:hypothetical protein